MMDGSATGRVVGVLSGQEAADSTIDALDIHGFDRAQFGALAPEEALKSSESASELAKNPSTEVGELPAQESQGALEGGLLGGGIFLGVLLAAGGPILAGGGLALALASGLGGGAAGGLIGGLMAHGFHRKHAEYVNSQLERGGIVLWISTRDSKQEDQAVDALRKAGAQDIEVQVSLKAAAAS